MWVGDWQVVVVVEFVNFVVGGQMVGVQVYIVEVQVDIGQLWVFVGFYSGMYYCFGEIDWYCWGVVQFVEVYVIYNSVFDFFNMVDVVL